LCESITSVIQDSGMAPDRRSELIAVRLTPEEARMLRELSDADGVYQSDVLRLQIRRLYAERFGDKPRQKPKRK
jgi:hypothetical protein